MNVLIGYGYHPVTTATYLQRALERRVSTTYVGTSYGALPGYPATADLRTIIASLAEQPDLYLHVDSGATFYLPRGLTGLDCVTACYLIDVHVQPRASLDRAMLFDYVFVAQRDFVEVVQKAGHPRVMWLPLACDPEVHRHYDVPARYDVAFVGATGAPYERRTQLLRRLAARFTINDYTHACTPNEMARIYSQARLVFNCSLRHEVNMRVFEGPATGTLLLTDRIGNGLDELVSDGRHVVLYDDDTLLDLVEHYLRDDRARLAIAGAGQAHVVRHHSYDRRVETILDAVFGAPGGPVHGAPLRRTAAADVELAYAAIFARARRVDDTLEQFDKLRRARRHHVSAARHLALSLLRRVKNGP